MQLDDDSIQILASLGNVDSDIARKVLQKHNGNMEKAADALLSGDTGEAASTSTWTQRNNTPEQGFYDTDVPEITIGPQLPAASQSSIDLTDTTTEAGPKFGPSNRAPNPDWQIVPSDVAVGGTRTPGISQEDQSLNDAIQRSLDDFQVVAEKEAFKLVHSVRTMRTPIALRPDIPALACAALVVQALYFVPQVRSAVASLRLPDIDQDDSSRHPARAVWSLIELFTNMDLASLAAIVDTEVLPTLDEEAEKQRVADTPTGRATSAVSVLCHLLEAHLSAQREDDENRFVLFEFPYVHVELNNRLPRKVGRTQTGGVVRVEIGGDSPERELMACLSSMLTRYDEGKSVHDLIVESAEVLVFSLQRFPTMPTIPKPENEAFIFPKSLYLDRFLFQNLELTNQKMLEAQDVKREIDELTNRSTTLTRLNQRDTMQDLKNTIYYYEHVAEAKDDPVRERVLKETTAQLKDILVMLESKIEALSSAIKDLEAKVAAILDCPELQQHQYDLRAVLMHTGLPGRKQLYSYVKTVEGTWWKTCDHEVIEVTEEIVLTDTTGVHLSAGPFMLFYSKHMSEEELHAPVSWPDVFTHSVHENNLQLFAMLDQEMGKTESITTTAEPTISRSPPPTQPSISAQRLPTAPLRSNTTPAYAATQPLRPAGGTIGPRASHRAGSRSIDRDLNSASPKPNSSHGHGIA